MFEFNFFNQMSSAALQRLTEQSSDSTKHAAKVMTDASSSGRPS